MAQNTYSLGIQFLNHQGFLNVKITFLSVLNRPISFVFLVAGCSNSGKNTETAKNRLNGHIGRMYVQNSWSVYKRTFF